MEFFIKKRATLPLLEINLIKDGRLDYNYIKTSLSGATIHVTIQDIDTNQYMVLNGVCQNNQDSNSIYYQFTKRNTNKISRYFAEFTITNDQGTIILPLREKIFVTVLDSFSDPDFCCT